MMYVLHSYGINPDTVPIDDDGRPQMERFLGLLQKRCEEERKQKLEAGGRVPTTPGSPGGLTSDVGGGIAPSEGDVLLSQGQKYQSHPGNLVLEGLIERELVAYTKASSRFEKTCVVMRIVQDFKESGGRFLIRKKKTKEWVEARNVAIQDGVGSRCRARMRKSVAKQSTNCTSTTKTTTTATASPKQTKITSPLLGVKEEGHDVLHHDSGKHSNDEFAQVRKLHSLQDQLTRQERIRTGMEQEENHLQGRLLEDHEIRQRLRRARVDVLKLQQHTLLLRHQVPGNRFGLMW